MRAAEVTRVSASDRDWSHIVRRQLVLQRHPEVRNLFGRDRMTFVVTAALFLAQLGIAAFVGGLGLAYWPLALVLALGFGAFANHANHVVIHDAIHNLVFRKGALNKLTAILADLPNAVPTAMAFRCYHLRHHSHLSSYDHDADVPSRWEVELVGNVAWRKAVWLFFFPLVQMARLSRLKGRMPLWRPWMFVNITAVVVFDLLVLTWLGSGALLYLLASFWFSVGGLHPLSARWLQEHFAFAPDQGTFDYTGPLNIVALNIGYHNEHHDFHEIPWTRLPRLRAMAPDFYATLDGHASWSGLLARFISDPRCSLATRSEHVGRGGARAPAPSAS